MYNSKQFEDDQLAARTIRAGESDIVSTSPRLRVVVRNDDRPRRMDRYAARFLRIVGDDDSVLPLLGENLVVGFTGRQDVPPIPETANIAPDAHPLDFMTRYLDPHRMGAGWLNELNEVDISAGQIRFEDSVVFDDRFRGRRYWTEPSAADDSTAEKSPEPFPLFTNILSVDS